MSSPLLDAALSYAALGWAVFPVHSFHGKACACLRADCDRPGKHPATRHGLNDASKDERALEAWWGKNPNYNVGIRTGAISGIFVLDVDSPKSGDETLESLIRDNGPLPETVEALTGGGGRHLVFTHPGRTIRNSVASLGPGLDVRGDGGYIVAPPSLHASGRKYEWEVSSQPADVEIAEAPPWLLDHLKPSERRAVSLAPVNGSAPNIGELLEAEDAGWARELLKGVGEGERNNAATRLAGRYLAQGQSAQEVYALLSLWNRGNAPPLEDRELRRVVESIAAREATGEVQAPETEEDREGLRAFLSTKLGLCPDEVRRISGDEPTYALFFGQATVRMAATALIVKSRFAAAIFAGARKLPVLPKSAREWRQIVETIDALAIDLDASEDATERGETDGWLVGYRGSLRLVTEIPPGERVPASGPFVRNDLVWCGVNDLIRYLRLNHHSSITAQRLAQRLKGHGIPFERVNTDTHSTRRVWGVADY